MNTETDTKTIKLQGADAGLHVTHVERVDDRLLVEPDVGAYTAGRWLQLPAKEYYLTLPDGEEVTAELQGVQFEHGGVVLHFKK